MIDDPARLLATAEPVDLLPARRGDEAARLQQPLELLAHAPLAGGRHYLLVRDARGVTYGVPSVVADGRVRRAGAGDGASEALIDGLAGGLAAPLTADVLHVATARGEHAVPVDQTNDLVLVGDSAVVKWFLHPAPEPQPGSVRARQLQGLPEVPRTWALVHADVDGVPHLIATVSDVVPDAEDGWDWAVDDVRGLATGTDPASALAWPSRLGDLTARLHVELARHGIGYAADEDVRAWQEWAERDLLDSGLEGSTAEAVRAAMAPLSDSAGTPVIGIHGDLHVGQVLRTRSSRALHVIDLDGSPLLTAAENLRPQPAARDVAGMLASLDHVGRVVLHRTPDLEAGQRQRVLSWIGQARAAFLTGYRAGLDRAGRADLLDESLLRPMLVQQECREYAYARRYLPHWRYVPDAALPALLEEPADEA